ncbi:hypothetical protein [Paracoccus yeei]|nr:hypothetical protein [Paracoccus yeei]
MTTSQPQLAVPNDGALLSVRDLAIADGQLGVPLLSSDGTLMITCMDLSG